MDIVVTTPKSEMGNASAEAERCLKAGGGFYSRTMSKLPKDLKKGDKVFYTEDGYVRGFATVNSIQHGDFTDEVSGTTRSGNQVIMSADSWKWVEPIPMKGFQGWRYFNKNYKVVGDWKSSKPSVGHKLPVQGD